MNPKVSQLRQELADREAIRNCLYRYCRGVDRCDEAMLRSAYWPDAHDDHLSFAGSPDEFIAWSMPILRGMDQSMHMIANIMIRIHGCRADAESYYQGFHRLPADGGAKDTFASGRYVDTFERRDDEWRILRRLVVVDWFRDYPDQAILIECMTYATAGMLTTREFIVIATWYLFDRPELLKDFLEGSETDQLAILYEVLRMEPVAGMIHRRATEDWTASNGEQVKAGTIYAIDIRAVNTDEAAAGACPFSFDQERAKKMKTPPMWMSFSEGAHRCPGNQVALHETRVFLDRLIRVPGIRLTRAPNVAWFGAVKGYELHGAIVECDLG